MSVAPGGLNGCGRMGARVQEATGRPLAGRAPDPTQQGTGQGSRRPRRPERPETGVDGEGLAAARASSAVGGRRSRGSTTRGWLGLAEAVGGAAGPGRPEQGLIDAGKSATGAVVTASPWPERGVCADGGGRERAR